MSTTALRLGLEAQVSVSWGLCLDYASTNGTWGVSLLWYVEWKPHVPQDAIRQHFETKRTRTVFVEINMRNAPYGSASWTRHLNMGDKYDKFFQVLKIINTNESTWTK